MDKVKLTISLSSRSAEIINYLQDRTDAVNKDEVFRQALRLFYAVVQAKEKGFELCIKDGDKLEPISILEEIKIQ